VENSVEEGDHTKCFLDVASSRSSSSSTVTCPVEQPELS
jgi:hypothetical protein